MSFYALTGLINALFAIVLGVLVINGDPKSKVGRTFFLLCSSLFVWGLGYFLWMTGTTESQAIFWTKTLMLGAIFIPVAYLHFVLQYLGLANKRRILIIGSYVLAVVFLVLNFTSSNFIAGVSPKLDFHFWPDAGPYYLFFLVFFFMAISFAIFSLLHKLKFSTGIKKQQLIVITTGAIIGLIGGSTNFPLWYGIEMPPYGNLLAVTFSASIAYAILRHHLFNIKVLLTEVSVAAVLIIALLQALTSDTELVVTRIGLFIALFVGGIILIKSVKNEVRRREEVEELAKEKTKALAELEQRNKNLATLQKISRLVLDEIELKPMAQKILDEIPRELENCRGALLNLVKGGQLGAYAISSTDITEKIYRMVSADISKYSYPLKSGFNLLHDAILTKQAKESARLSDFISPPIPKALALHGGTQVQLV